MSTQSEFPAPLGRRLRPWTITAPALTVLVVAVAYMGLKEIELPTVAPIDPDNALQISLVQPVEPEVIPGGTMDVGTLVDGYVHVAARRSRDMDPYDADYASGWIEPESTPPVERVAWRSDDEPPAPPAPQAEPVRPNNPYGFDAAGPDYAAAREARRARLERMQADGWREVPSGARLSMDSAFY